LLPIEAAQFMSTNNTSVETVSPAADKAKLAAAVLLVVGGVVAYYLVKGADWMRWGALLALLLAGAGMFLISETGKQFIAFARDSWNETYHKVVWPKPKETWQMTGYVFAFVVVMALFLWLTDKTLEWVLYDLVLKWK
jgi:preprotein translocase subunit SecE